MHGLLSWWSELNSILDFESFLDQETCSVNAHKSSAWDTQLLSFLRDLLSLSRIMIDISGMMKVYLTKHPN